MININMRCIEMILVPVKKQGDAWLTLTWDVLKYEIRGACARFSVRLTLTWDVLKCRSTVSKPIEEFWLTLTWDVLKFL